MAPTRVISVIAAHEGLRRSIAFALEAEGYEVVAKRKLSDLPAADANRAVCAVVDEEAVAAASGDWERLQGFGSPVVLLSNGTRDVPAAFVSGALTKPLLGRSLTDRVAAMIAKLAAGEPAT